MLDLDLEWIATQELLDNNNLAIKICRFNLMRAARQRKEKEAHQVNGRASNRPATCL